MIDKSIPILSIKQPWAWLIMNEYKDIENRSWQTKYRGPLYIHAGKKFDKTLFDNEPSLESCTANQITAMFLGGMYNHHHEMKLGGIVGRVRLVDILDPLHKPNYSYWWEPGFYGWVFEDPEKIDFFPCRGKLGLFKLED